MRPELPELPGISFDAERRYVEVEAVVVGNGVEWLELIACTPQSREHEALVAVHARPSHVHLALILLGVEPGHPQRRVATADGGFTLERATGGAVALFFVQPDAQTPPVPATAWVLDQATGEPMRDRDNRWLFTGSRVMDDAGEPVYLADVNGTVASLVNFGDDLLARPTDQTNDNDGGALTARPQAMPPDGTPLRLRIVPLPPP